MFERSSVPGAFVDPDGRLLRVNDALCALVGHDRDDIVGTMTLWDLTHPHDLGALRTAFGAIAPTEAPHEMVFRARRADGEWRWLAATSVDLTEEPLVAAHVCHLRDVTDHVQVEHALRHQALHDALTGLPNRTLLSDRIATAISRAVRMGTTFAVLFCDLDHFKRINDTLGHEVGDEVLLEVARRLHERLRESDTLARIGGDEFVVLAEQADRIAAVRAAVHLADQLLDALAEPILVGDHLRTVSASIGIAIHDGTRDANDMLRDADVAMYAAKARGRGQAVFHDQEMRAQVERRFAMEGVVRRALSEGGVRVAFQPIVDLATQRTVGAESLVRLDVDGRSHEPEEFMDAAEESGAIVDLGEEVLLVAIEEAATWPEAAFVTVNMSARQLSDVRVTDIVFDALATFELDPGRLVIEVTESALIEASEAIDRTMRELTEAGVRIALDDFGTGWSSLSYLRRFPVSIVKIDKVFVRGVARIGSRDIEVIRAVVGLATSLGIEVVAEGIETDLVAAIVTGLGCHMGQGFLYGRPLGQLPTGAHGTNRGFATSTT